MTFEEIMDKVTVLEVATKVSDWLVHFLIALAFVVVFVYLLIMNFSFCSRKMAACFLTVSIIVSMITGFMAIPRPTSITIQLIADTNEVELTELNKYFVTSEVSIGDETLVCVAEPRHSFKESENYYKKTIGWFAQRKDNPSESVEH